MISEIEVERCPIVSAIRELSGEWNLVIIRYLMTKEMGFNELLRNVKGLSSKTLSSCLKSLAAKGIVHREVVSTQPFSVSYSLTEKGRSLEPVFEMLGEWGSRWSS